MPRIARLFAMLAMLPREELLLISQMIDAGLDAAKSLTDHPWVKQTEIREQAERRARRGRPKGSTRLFWSPGMIAYLEQARARPKGQVASYTAIARELTARGDRATPYLVRVKWHELLRATPKVKPPTVRPPWTPAEEQLLLKLRKRKVAMHEIAKKLGRSWYACVAKQKQLRKRS